MECGMRIKRITMENLPTSQVPMHLDLLANDVFRDMCCFQPDIKLVDIFDTFRELNEEQDIFIFNNGTVAATKKGLLKFN
jgi:hypothetical protein